MFRITVILLPLLSFPVKLTVAPTAKTHIGDGTIFDMWPWKYFFVIALPLMLLAMLWAKPWPPGHR